ncbi:unnamed protein product [Rotaria magnacalcarata]|nr:unnamed protein product [Rotaria magnacalcarata]CAF3865454.1 unnamed protein product [Rotaria magnacalcarata]CAF3871292.1 unnamed protein product [Rotaria magnacalcarata]
MKILLFSDEKQFDIDRVYNRQNDRIWAPSREKTDADDEIHRKIKFPQAFKDGRKLIGNEFTFQRDGAPANKDHHTQAWCKDHFWDFWPKSRWQPNSPDLNALDYSIRYESCDQMKWDRITNKKILID